MNLQVIRPGVATTVQDRGRHGLRHFGVGVAGALDSYSSQVANLLLGNAPDAALLECTLSGPTLRLARAARIALCGADADADCDGVAVPSWRPLQLPAQSTLRIGGCRRGARVYLAIDGGIDVPPLLGSRSTDLRAGFGGLDGRTLRAGDVLPLTAGGGEIERVVAAPWWIDPAPDVELATDAVARVIPEPDAPPAFAALLRGEWRVASASDRQGLRLDGAPLRGADGDLVSEPVVPGTVQLPPDGQPIVLLADAQTVGGYPRLGQVASADLPRLAQCRPGERVRFLAIDAAAAAAAWRARRQRLARIALAIAQRQARLR